MASDSLPLSPECETRSSTHRVRGLATGAEFEGFRLGVLRYESATSHPKTVHERFGLLFVGGASLRSFSDSDQNPERGPINFLVPNF